MHRFGPCATLASLASQAAAARRRFTLLLTSRMYQKLLLLLGVFMAAARAQAQTIEHNAIVLGHVDSVASNVLHEQRKFWVYVPASARNPTYQPQRYPVVYLLDGDAYFASVTAMARQLSEDFLTNVFPEMIVVGIPNTNRLRDFTPTRATSSAVIPTSALKESGGGEQFTAFLAQELLPYVAAHYPASSYRALIGHSLGGVLVMNTVVHHPDLFTSYVALDPTMFWDEQKLLGQAKAALARPQYQGHTLFVASANTQPPGLDSAQIQHATSLEAVITRAKWTLRDELAHNPHNGLRWAYKNYPSETHNTVPLLATYDALHFLFQPYALSPAVTVELFGPVSKAKNAASLLEAHYRQVSRQMGYVALPPEPFVNDFAYYLLQSGKTTRALSFFQLNARSYPASFNAHDSLGDCYLALGQRALAADSFTKALQLKDNAETRQKLAQVQAKK
jgi:predicted alpha/beta superfamily hydrolase